MVVLNFGVSSYSRHSPGVPWEERKMEVPELSGLSGIPSVTSARYLDREQTEPSKFSLPNYSDAREGDCESLPAVFFDLKEDHSHDTYDMKLIWMAQRKEWIAIEHHSWSEGDFSIDEYEDGPYALDTYCAKMLAKAYGIREEVDGIAAKPPSELEEIAAKAEVVGD
jgi:hypothetical protein